MEKITWTRLLITTILGIVLMTISIVVDEGHLHSISRILSYGFLSCPAMLAIMKLTNKKKN